MKPFLKVVAGPSKFGEIIPVLPNCALLVGRAGACTATFAADELMSTSHFSLAENPQGFFLADLGSTNGTFVNGVRTVHCQIYPGDQILAGRTVFLFEHENEPPIVPAANASQPHTGLPIDLPESCLRIATKHGQERILYIGNRITIGRTELAEWVFPTDARMSSEHMAIQFRDGDWEVVDLTSSNGTFVNEQRIHHCCLKTGDSIAAGGTLFSISILEPTVAHDAVKDAEVAALDTMPAWPLAGQAVESAPTEISQAPSAEWNPTFETYVDDESTRKDRIPNPIASFRATLDCLTQSKWTTELAIGQQLLIGRSIYADISVPNDLKMSTEHARLRVISNEDLVIEDLSSTNGTEVNGVSIKQAALNHGDRILIGEQIFCILFNGREAPRAPVPLKADPFVMPATEMESPPLLKPIPATVSHPSRQPWLVETDFPSIDPAIPFESFPCGSGLVFFSGCLPSFDPIDIARRLTLASPGWLLKQVERAGDGVNSATANTAQPICMERISPMDPSWMIPWSQTWGQQRSLVIYSRSDEAKIMSTFQALFGTLDATSQKFPSHSDLFDFLANRLSDTVQRVFSPLDAILIELYGGKQWAYMAPRDLESVLPQLRFRKKHRW